MAMATEGVAAAESAAERFWKEDMTKMALGTRLLFVNDFAGAESVFRSGMMQERDVPKGEKEVRDLRGAFALQYALVSVIKGVASLADDQLDECLQRLWFAEELAGKDSEWLGKSVVRGIVTLVGGVIQCLQHSFVKGVYNVLKSWVWIKVLQSQALNYEGKEREVVRSCALLTLGIFNLLLSLLPSSMLRAATFLSGFQGDREAGLRMLLDCWKEDGMFSPWGALVWVAYQVDTKTFLDERLSEEDVAECSSIFRWAAETHPNSVFFSGIEADFEACRRNVALSMSIVDRVAPFAKELKALEWALNYKRGVYELVDLNFSRAAQYFESSLEVYVRVGRRSMVPFMGIYAFLCYHVVADLQSKIEIERDELLIAERSGEDEVDSTGSPAFGAFATDDEDGGTEVEADEEEMDAATAAAHADEMHALVAKYKKMDKDNWGRQDRYAFALFDEYDQAPMDMLTSDEDLQRLPREPWPLLDLVESMIIRMRCTRWMDSNQAARLLQLLQDENEARAANADDDIRVCACFAQLLLERGQRDAALEWSEKGLALEPELVENKGFVPMLLYLKALNMFQRGQVLAAQHSLAQLDGKLDKKSWIHHYILFKSNILRKELAGSSLEKDAYITAEVPAGDSHQLVVPTLTGNLISWDWACSKHDVQFTAIFRPANGSDIVMISSIDRHMAEDGPSVGSFESPAAGDLIFEWDNRYSFLRSKQVVYRVSQVAMSDFEDASG